jgi:hypothetical protein
MPAQPSRLTQSSDIQKHPARAYFQQLYAASLGAVAGSGAVERTIRIAGFPIRLVFAGEAMVSQVMRALRHLESGDQQPEPDVTVYVWDSATIPEQVSPGFRIRAILVPEVDPEADTRLVPISGAAALTALAPSSILLLPGKDRQSFRQLSNLVRQLPAYKLQLGASIEQIPAVIKELLVKL